LNLDNEKICPYCANVVPEDAEYCPSCGALLGHQRPTPTDDSSAKARAIFPESSFRSSSTISIGSSSSSSSQYYPPQPTKVVYVRKPSSASSTEGIVALVFAILSCVGVIPCIGAIIAITLGQKERESSAGSTAFVLGWISCGLNIIGLIIILLINLY